MKTYNFGEKLSNVRAEIFKAFKNLIEEKGHNHILDVERFKEDIELDTREISKIEYSKSCNDILFYFSNDEDYCFFSDYETLKLAWYYDDLVILLKTEKKLKKCKI